MPDLPFKLPFSIEIKRQSRSETIDHTERLIVRLEKTEFPVCTPHEVRRRGFFGFREVVTVIHRTSEGTWDIRNL